MSRRALAVGILSLLLILPVSGQQPPTFRSEVNYVEVTARVIGADGQFVADLQQDDFELLEEGRPQKLTDFRLVDLPSTTQETPRPTAWGDADPDVRSNADPVDGRVYVLVVDNLHLKPERIIDAQKMMRRFLERYFVEGDIAAVVNTKGSAEPAQEFTTSRAKLLSAIGRFGVYVDTLVTDEPTVRDMVPAGAMGTARDTLESLDRISRLLGTLRGRRKAIVFFSEGPGYCSDMDVRQTEAAPASGMSGNRVEILTPGDVDAKRWSRGALDVNVRRLVATANRNNVAIYSFDPKQMAAIMGDCDSESGIESLRDISDQTAGFAVTNSNSYDTGFERLRQENSRYYVLGYYPTEKAPEGSYRRIQVRTRRPGLKVQAREGYRVAPRPASRSEAPKAGEVSASLREAMDSVVPVTGMRMTASAVAFKGDGVGANVLVSVFVDGRDLTFQPGGGKDSGAIELAWGSMNSRGEHGANQFELVQLPVDEVTRAGIVRAGLRIVRTLPVAPGRHQLRVGVSDRPTGRSGVVHIDVVVPNYEKVAGEMSGVLVSSSLAGRVPTARGGPIEELRRLLPGPPAMTREFRASEDLAVYAEVYGSPVPGDGSVTLAVLDEGGRQREVQVGTPPAGTTGAPSAGQLDQARADRLSFRRMVSLKALPPGRYCLQLQAAPPRPGQSPLTRSVPFTIVP